MTTVIQEITHALAAHLDGWPFVYTQISVGCVTVNYDLYQGADAELAETARERIEFDTRIVVAAKIRIQGSLLLLDCHRSAGVVEPTEEDIMNGVSGSGRLGMCVGSYVHDMNHPDSIENILACLYQHLREQGYSEQCPEFP